MAHDGMSRREDLEDMLADPAYFQAAFHTLSKVKELYHSQAEMGIANETIASALVSTAFGPVFTHARG
jgi:ESCRT-I complex subunit VPS37